jgi:SulP family sulfate permease
LKMTNYKSELLKFDILAGLTTASVVIPKSMAFAVIAGLPVQAGLYVAFVPMLVYAFLGTSRNLSVSTTTTLAILTASQLAISVPDGDPAKLMSAAATLALLTGAVLIFAGVARLGFLANFISDPVLTGFKAGIGLVIVVDQVPKLLGIHIEKSGFFRNIWSMLSHSPESHVPTLILAVVMLVLLFGLEHFLPKIPAPLVAVVVGLAAAGFLGLEGLGVALTGPIPAGLPMPEAPDLSLVQSLLPGALGIALMSFTESIAAGRAFVQKGEPRPSPNRELIALGAANVAGSFFQSFPAGGGTSQTAVNAGAGARSQVSAVVTVCATLATLLVLAPLIALLPLATLAAIVVVTSVPLLSPNGFQSILSIRRTEFIWALAAFAGVAVLGTLSGILVAIALSILVLFYQANHPPVYALARKPGTDIFRPVTDEHEEDETLPGLVIIRTEGRLNFASAPRVGERMWKLLEEADPKVVIFELSAVPDIEYTALQALIQVEDKLGESGISMYLAGLNPEVLKVVRSSSLNETLGEERMFIDVREAVKAFEKLASAD